MEMLFVEVAKQVPALMVLCYIVFVFVRYLGSRDQTLKEIGESCHMVQQKSIDVMQEVNRSIGEMTATISALNGKGKS